MAGNPFLRLAPQTQNTTLVILRTINSWGRQSFYRTRFGVRTQTQRDERLTRKARVLRPPGVALATVLECELETHSVPLSIVSRVPLSYKSCKCFIGISSGKNRPQ